MTPVGGRLRMTVLSRRIVPVILALGLVATNLLVDAQPTYAAAPTCTVTWTGTAGDGAWLTAGNWNPGHVPTAADYACVLATAGVITVAGSNTILGVDAEGAGLFVSGSLSLTDTTQDSIINALTLSGFVGGAAKLTIKGATTWNSGSLGGSGTVVNSGTVAIATNASVAVLGNLLNQGTVHQPGGNGPTVCLQDGVTLENAGTFDISGISVSGLGGGCGAGSGTGRLLNDASATISGNGTVASLFDNNGLVTIGGGGSLNIRNGNSPGQSDAGTYQTVAGQGPINLMGGTRSFAGATIAGGDALGTGVTLIGGTLTGTLTLSGDMFWGTTFQASGTFSGATLMGPGRLHLSTNGTLALGGSLINRATVEGEYHGFANGFCINDGATLENAGLMSIPSGGVSVCTGNTGTGTFQNDASGTLTAAYGINGASISTSFSNAGALELYSGSLAIKGLFSNYDASSRTLAGGSYRVLQTPSQHAELSFSGADIATLNAAATIAGPGAAMTDLAHTNALRNLSTIGANGFLTIRDDAQLATSGPLMNQGTLALGMGTSLALPLAVGGNYAQAPGATLQTNVAGNQFGEIRMNGSATIDGMLAIVTAPGSPPTAQTIQIVGATSVAGQFSSISGTAIGNGLSYHVQYLPTAVDLFVSGPSYAALFASDPAVPATWPGTLPVAGGASTSGLVLPYPFAGVQFDLSESASRHVLIAGGPNGTEQFCVDGQWTLTMHGPVSKSLSGSGCQAPIDFAALGVPDGSYGVQLTLTAPGGAATFGTSNIELVSPGSNLLSVASDFRPQVLGIRFPVRLAGTVSGTIGTLVGLPVTLDVALLPVAGIHGVFSYDPAGIEVTGINLASGWSGNGRTNPAVGDGGFFEYGPPKSNGTVVNLGVMCLKQGTWPVSFSGNWWAQGSTNNGDYTDTVSGVATVTCSAPPPSTTVTTPNVAIDPVSGTVAVTVTATGLGAASSAKLTDTSGAIVSTSTSVNADPSGASLSAHFPATKPGLYDIAVVSGSGSVVAKTTGTPLEVLPALPLFSIKPVDVLGNVPGIPTTHLWRVSNLGTANGVAILVFTFPSYISPEPTFNLLAAPAGSVQLLHGLTGGGWVEYAAIPVPVGASTNIGWTVNLPPSAVFGTNPVLSLGAPVPMIPALAGQYNSTEWAAIAQAQPSRIVDQALGAGINDYTAALRSIIAMPSTSIATYVANFSYPELRGSLGFIADAIVRTEVQGFAQATGGVQNSSAPATDSAIPAPPPPTAGPQPPDSLNDPLATSYGNFVFNTGEAQAAGYGPAGLNRLAGQASLGPTVTSYAVQSIAETGYLVGDTVAYQSGTAAAVAEVPLPGAPSGSQPSWMVTARWNPSATGTNPTPATIGLTQAVSVYPAGRPVPTGAVPYLQEGSAGTMVTADVATQPAGTSSGNTWENGDVEIHSATGTTESFGSGTAATDKARQRLDNAQHAASEGSSTSYQAMIAEIGGGALIAFLCGVLGFGGLVCVGVGVAGYLLSGGWKSIYYMAKAIASEDPNEITAQPAGEGPAGWITPEPISYVIHFENNPAATAAAQNIRVTARLDPNLDPSTLEFGDTSFPGAQVSFDSATQVLTWVLPAINLPPDVTPPAGQGFVSFTAAPRAGLTTGTVIAESATVLFDFNPPVVTQPLVRTIDATVPASRISALPASEPASNFTVSWSGTDVGSGASRFTILVSVDAGPFVPWLLQTGASNGIYVGAPGHTYAFYSRATDAVGNIEAAHTAADTTTTVAVGTNPASAISEQQYALPNSDGATWVDMDPTNLRVPFTPSVDSLAIISANADLWTSNAGINQDLGIALSGGAFPTIAGQPEAWKESGGFAGTFSPNAAYAQAIVRVNAGTAYTARLQWKTNRPASGRTIYAAAGSNGAFSPTRLTVRLVPLSPSTVANAAITTQPRLSGSDGAVWRDIDTGLTAPYTPTANGFVIVSGNADLWTSVAGLNQDLGISVSGGAYPTTAGQPEAWKESGGFAGTYSPNAAFVQTVVPVVANTPYTFKLQWKTNKPSAASATIWAGAGPINGQFSPTRLALQFIPSGTSAPGVVDAVSTKQYTQAGSDGVTWVDMDSSSSTPLTLSFSSTTSCIAVLGANADLWTSVAGYNQDIGLSLNGTLVSWKESGGFAGTFSPNAAYVQSVVAVTPGTVYTLKVQWKTNRSSPSTAAIWAGAGPIGTKFSPTRVSATLVGCQ